MLNLIGRNDEKEILRAFYESQRPEFLAIYGRRRIGKTALIKRYFEEDHALFFNVTGIQKGTKEMQIRRFTKEIGKVFYHGAEIKEQKNWVDTLDNLSMAIENTVPKNKKIVLFFDEFPWMATHKSGLLQALEHCWNHQWSNDSRIKLIICGSSASWIINKIINNKGGLHNRITRKIHLMPFNLAETAEFLTSLKIKLDYKQIIELYMVTGGVPYYLMAAEKNKTATQLIDQLAFSKNSILFNEFDNLFSSLFENSENYIDLLRTVGKKHRGVSLEEILKGSHDISRGGRVLERLKELEDTGFILSFMPHEHKKRGRYYRLIDEYTSFYFDWIEPIKTTLQKNDLEANYWAAIKNTPAWYNWAGYAFESICYKHIKQIKKKLGIQSGAMASGWRYVPIDELNENGAEIDLLFDRGDDAITLCEIKYTAEPFVIKKEYAKNLNNKLAVFKKITKTRKQLFLVLISANGLKETIYSEELLHGLVILEDLFSKC